MTNDLGYDVAVILATLGSVVGLLFLLTVIDPRTDKTPPGQPKAVPARHRR